MKLLSLVLLMASLAGSVAFADTVEDREALKVLIKSAPKLIVKGDYNSQGSLLDQLTDALMTQFSPSGDPVFTLNQVVSECEVTKAALKTCRVNINSNTYRWDEKTGTVPTGGGEGEHSSIFQFQMTKDANGENMIYDKLVRIIYAD